MTRERARHIVQLGALLACALGYAGVAYVFEGPVEAGGDFIGAVALLLLGWHIGRGPLS